MEKLFSLLYLYNFILKTILHLQQVWDIMDLPHYSGNYYITIQTTLQIICRKLFLVVHI